MTAPAMIPMADTTTWFEFRPDLLSKDPKLATLLIRVGMASNALSTYSLAGANAARNPPGQRSRDILVALVTSAALLNEAIKLAQNGMKDLRHLAAGAGARQELLDQIGQLCAGKHPASASLHRARNQIGFHWDAELVSKSIAAYVENERLIWLESNSDSTPVHRFAMEITAHALLPPEITKQANDRVLRESITQDLAQVSAAMSLIIEFFTAATYGFMKLNSMTRETRRVGWLRKMWSWLKWKWQWRISR